MEVGFAKNLKSMMKASEITQAKLSADTGIAQSAVSAWLSEKKEPSLMSLWLLADYFDCTIDELVGRKA